MAHINDTARMSSQYLSLLFAKMISHTGRNHECSEWLPSPTVARKLNLGQTWSHTQSGLCNRAVRFLPCSFGV